jgi:uncharacterized protein (TIGR02453 family)
MGFTGFPAEGIEFYEQLGADNSRAFWQANKSRYDEYVKRPMVSLTDELSGYGPFHMFRPHNDLRFSKNKPPYKVHQGAYGESEGGAGHYMHFSADGLLTGCGYYSMATDQLARFRAAVDADATGEEIAGLVAELDRRKYEIGAIGELKTAPRGYPKDHRRIELLRRKGLMASKDFGAPKWIQTKVAAKRIREMWEGAAEMCNWLDAHVGPSTLEPDGFF